MLLRSPKRALKRVTDDLPGVLEDRSKLQRRLKHLGPRYQLGNTAAMNGSNTQIWQQKLSVAPM